MLLETHSFFANLSWLLLNIILISRPLAVMTRNKYLFKLLRFRRELGILCGLSAIIHASFFLLGSNLILAFFTDSHFWSLDSFFGWGSLALILMLAPLLTSNDYSIRFFKKYWKKIQQVTYGVYLATAIHVAMVSEDFLGILLPVSIWLALWLYAQRIMKNRAVND